MKSPFMVAALALAVILPWPSYGQTTSTGTATTVGPCSPAVSGNNDSFTITCGGIDKSQGQKMLAILNKILANQVNPEEVNRKLDEILKALAASADRTLTVPQAKAIADAAKDIPPDIKIVVEHPTDYESSEYAKTIRDTIVGVHPAELSTALSYGGQPPPVGLFVFAHTNDARVLPYANQFYAAIKNAGIPCGAYQVDFVTAGTLMIRVGVKPPLNLPAQSHSSD